MAEITNTALLEKLMAHARTIGDRKNPPLTAERLLVSVMDAMDNTLAMEDGESAEGMARLIREAGIDPAAGRETLLAYINKDTGISFLDDLYMKKKLSAAAERAKSEHLDSITPELLLSCILADPSSAIKACLPTAVQESLTVPEPEPEMKTPPAQPENPPAEEIPAKSESEPPKAETNAPDAKAQIAALTERVKSLRLGLSETVIGQDHAVSVFASGYFQAELLSMTDKKRTRPSATFLFAGPPGVGKTFFAENAARLLGLPFERFDMSEYADHNAATEFCGSDSVYKGAKSGNFTSFVQKNPKSVVLFDEIEKAHISIIHLFLQILDAGRIRDSNTDAEIPLRDVIMIFTTNAGKQLYEDADTADFSSVSRKVILKALQRDVNPNTGIPYFPAAICSRFASGNVVMFNHITAHGLTAIAKKEILRQAENFETSIGVRVDVDERVYSALLFAEGGAADARTVRSRAEAFFDAELFELFRLIGEGGAIDAIDTIKIGVDLPPKETEIGGLFESRETPAVLLFASDKTAALCREKNPACTLLAADTAEEAEAHLVNAEIRLILLDITCGLKEKKKYLNAEDADSAARDFFRRVREMYGSIPVYLLSTEDHPVSGEEAVSFMRQGVRGILTVGEGKSGKDSFAETLTALCARLHQQHSMERLAKSNKLVTFETAQRLTRRGKTAEIRLFDFTLSVAMDPEDSENVLSRVSKPSVRFDQVIGAEDAKAELKYFVQYLKNPKKYLGTGVAAPKGVLLYGPPGTGKTMLARAMAGESDVTFLTAEGNQFLKKYVGEGPEKVHELFRTARKYAPSVLFIDEIDAIAKERTGGDRSAAEATLTAFLTEMDGFKNDTAKPVFVLAATNFDVEPGRPKSLDPALMRRFDRRVYIDLPNRDDRVRYMNMKIAANPAFSLTEEKVKNLAVRSTGMSLAQLESVFELALRTAIREGGTKVTDEVLDEAFETFNGGERKNWDLTELQRIARHEAGHAFLCWHAGETPSYVTVVARGDHGGYMQHGDSEGKAIYTKEDCLARIRTSLGGRAAELVYYGEEDGVSSGASGDLASATELARRIVCSYGMDKAFGLAAVDPESARTGPLSGEVRAAVNRILTAEMEKAVALIRDNRPCIDGLVDTLLTKNHLPGREIRAIFENASR